MPAPFRPTDGPDYLANLHRLLTARWLVLLGLTLLCAMTPGLLGIPLQQQALFALLALSAVLTLISTFQIRHADSATAGDLFRQLLLDIATLSGVLFFSGGATNPLVSLLLPPIAIAALTLPIPYAIATGGLAISIYSLLLTVYIPLPFIDPARATHLHLIGMWMTFSASAAMIAWFVIRMTHLIRQRDAELAAQREQAMRDERILALGTLAAGAAHELGTPLGSIALLAGELIHDPDLSPEAREDIELIREQLATCKAIISRLSRQAGAERLEDSPLQAVDRWLDHIRQRWHALRPDWQSTLQIAPPADHPPLILADPRLEQAIHNLLNNAAQACQDCPKAIEIGLSWDEQHIKICIRDHGPGFSATILRDGGHQPQPAHENGQGIGLLLTRAAIEQLNGRLSLLNPSEGGAMACIEFPRNKS